MSTTSARAASAEAILLERGMLSPDQLRIAEMESARTGQPVSRLLVSLSFVSEATLREALSEWAGTRSVDLSRTLATPAALALVPREFARQHSLLPLNHDAVTQHLTLATADPGDIVAQDRLRALLPRGTQLTWLLAGESEIARAIDLAYGHPLAIDDILSEIENGGATDAPPPTGGDGYSQPVVRLVYALLADAARQGASDIHFEPEAGFLRIRYRLDGLLRQIRALHNAYWPAMAVRIKVLAGMNIAESRAPQDGRFSLSVNGRAIDFRVASLPTLHGENLVLRLLDRHKGIVPLAELGLDTPQAALLHRMLARPEGIILVTGPTGSGKTTTLYSLLKHRDDEGTNIMTLEDPVEYPMPRIRQSNVAENARLDFADGIRALLRQDPDVILVGEVRDAATAEMAFHAAMTGHQVFSTLHCASALGAIPRLRGLGVRPEIMAGNLIGIIAQRLVRRLCPDCREPADGPLPGEDDDRPHYRAGRCPACHYTGYRGRLPVLELLRADENLDELIAAGASPSALLRAARAAGHRQLADDALARVRAGHTSLDEVARVIDLSDWR